MTEQTKLLTIAAICAYVPFYIGAHHSDAWWAFPTGGIAAMAACYLLSYVATNAMHGKYDDDLP